MERHDVEALMRDLADLCRKHGVVLLQESLFSYWLPAKFDDLKHIEIGFSGFGHWGGRCIDHGTNKHYEMYLLAKVEDLP